MGRGEGGGETEADRQRYREAERQTLSDRERGAEGAGGRAPPFKGGELRMCRETTQQDRALPVYWTCAQGHCTLPGLQGAGQVCPNANTFTKIGTAQRR